jgi:hypothetical protein
MLAALAAALETPWTWGWLCSWIILLAIPYAALWSVVRVIRFAWTGR